MEIISQNNPTISKSIKKQNDMIFTMEDVRNVIQQKREQEEQSTNDNIIEIKQDIIAAKANQSTPQKVNAASIADILGFNPSSSKQTATRDKDPSEVPAKYRKYYKLLLKLKSDLKTGLTRLTKEHLSEGNSSPSDADIDSFDSGFALSLLSNEQEALIEIEKAIERIHNGTYGVCEATGKLIESKRLEVVPFTRFSLEGQQEQEKLKSAAERINESIFEGEQTDDVDGFSNYEEE